jgi:hypothetical protein
LWKGIRNYFNNEKKAELSNSYIALLFVAKKSFGVYAIIEKCKDE